MKKLFLQPCSSCQSSARTAEFFSCQPTNSYTDFLKDTIIIVSFLLCLIAVLMMLMTN